MGGHFAHAQFAMQASGSTASLRGIVSLDGGNLAWASGTGGTVLRTTDGGRHWDACATPPDAAKLDFRAVQAFDEKTAFVMSVGAGALSRVYRTTDGCLTWQLVLTNPASPDGFFDGIFFLTPAEGWLLGDPVHGSFYIAYTQDGGNTWTHSGSPTLAATDKAGAFAASNQSVAWGRYGPMFGGSGGTLYRGHWNACSQSTMYNDPEGCLRRLSFDHIPMPLASGNGSSGLFALGVTTSAFVAVGGDYSAPDNAAGTAAYSRDEGATWTPSERPPRGYRSSVAYDSDTDTWIATGPTGTDVSIDDGHHWRPLTADAARGDTSDADRQWNALALPFVVGPKGRIGRLRADALTKR
jgi:photosystem II stability/assembly factor-like uncharacterized protein